jgi:hypothetical protein
MMEVCNGCILPPTEDFIEDFFKKCHLAIEWHSSLIEEEYNQNSNELLYHFSTKEQDIDEDNNVNLEDCLRMFHKEEDLGTDPIHCS